MSAKRQVRVFVYGTLMGGYPLHDSWMKDSTFVGESTILGYTLLDLGPYPALLKVVDPIDKTPITSFAVKGEVYLMPEKSFAALAAMETRVGYTVEQLPDKTFVFLFETIGNNLNHWKKTGGVDYQDNIPF